MLSTFTYLVCPETHKHHWWMLWKIQCYQKVPSNDRLVPKNRFSITCWSLYNRVSLLDSCVRPYAYSVCEQLRRHDNSKYLQIIASFYYIILLYYIDISKYLTRNVRLYLYRALLGFLMNAKEQQNSTYNERSIGKLMHNFFFTCYIFMSTYTIYIS